MDGYKVTINDVAREANVSRATIYRVLYNKGYVSGEKKKAVLEAVEKFGFSPNKAAQTLATNRKYTIAAVFPTVEKFFWDEVEYGIDTAARELEITGVNLIKFPVKMYDIEEQRQMLGKILDFKVDGLAVAPAHASKLNDCIGRFIDKNIPVVTFNSDAPKSGRICFVGQDMVRSGALAAELMGLFLKGKGKVVIFRAVKDLLAIQQRVIGFTEKIETDYPGIDIAGCYDFDESEEKAYVLTREAISNNPDLSGIYVTNVYVDVAGRALKDMNPGRKIALVGFDITDETRGYIKNGIIDAVIKQEPFFQGYKPIQILYNMMCKNEKPACEVINTMLEIVLHGNV